MEEPKSADSLKPMQLPGKKKSTSIVVTIIIVLLVAALGYLGWQWWTLGQDKARLENDVQTLNIEINNLKAQLAAKAAEKKVAAPKPCDGTITQDLKDNIRDAVSSKNLAALASYMTNPVTVILAASEGLGPRTPDQAVTDMEYINMGTAPWDFNLSAATLATYEAGFYKDYFDDNTVVGKSANKYVVSVDFDNCAKINKVFMTGSEDQLLP
jgi:hypothetical protein